MANHVTPTGSVAWAALLEPQQDAYNDEMNWNVGLVLTEEDLAPVLAVFEKTIEDAQKRGDFPANLPVGEKMKWPYKPSIKKEEDGTKVAEEGKFAVSFKRKTTRTIRGEQVNNSAPQILDSTGQLVVGQKPDIGGGSLVRVIYRPYAYKNKAFCGVGAQILGVQIVELKERDNITVDAVDGGWVAEAPRDDLQSILDGEASGEIAL